MDPFDQPGFGRSVARPRAPLAMEPHSKSKLSNDNRARVMCALADGYPLAAIARALSVTVPTLKRLIAAGPEIEYEVEAQRSFEEGQLRDDLKELAREGDTVAAIFLAKARHGWRDRDDAKLKLEPSVCGVLAVPGVMPLDEWSIAAAKQQAPYRELPTEQPLAEVRSRSLGIEGLTIQRALPCELLG